MEISFTRLRVYLECPWKYKLLFVDSQKIPPTPKASLGLSLHRALERFYRSGAGDRERLLECYDQECVRSGFPTPEDRARWHAKGRRILESYFERDAARRTKIIGVEKEFIYPLGRHTVRGMVDRIDLHPDGRHELIDYKTQSEPKADLGDNLQLRFYALGVRESLSLDPALLTVDYLAAGRACSVAYDGKGEGELKELIARTADQIERGDFRPDTGFCARCDFRGDCAHSCRKTGAI